MPFPTFIIHWILTFGNFDLFRTLDLGLRLTNNAATSESCRCQRQQREALGDSSRHKQWTDGLSFDAAQLWSDTLRGQTWSDALRDDGPDTITRAVIMWELGGNELEDNSEISSRQCDGLCWMVWRQFESSVALLTHTAVKLSTQ